VTGFPWKTGLNGANDLSFRNTTTTVGRRLAAGAHAERTSDHGPKPLEAIRDDPHVTLGRVADEGEVADDKRFHAAPASVGHRRTAIQTMTARATRDMGRAGHVPRGSLDRARAADGR